MKLCLRLCLVLGLEIPLTILLSDFVDALGELVHQQVLLLQVDWRLLVHEVQVVRLEFLDKPSYSLDLLVVFFVEHFIKVGDALAYLRQLSIGADEGSNGLNPAMLLLFDHAFRFLLEFFR